MLDAQDLQQIQELLDSREAKLREAIPAPIDYTEQLETMRTTFTENLTTLRGDVSEMFKAYGADPLPNDTPPDGSITVKSVAELLGGTKYERT